MKATCQQIRQHPAAAGLLPAMLIVLFYLLLRNTGIYPFVFIDEWIYSSGARFLQMAEAAVPSYVYFALYSVTNSCGDSFMECNRLLNAVLHVGASPLIYLLGRRVAPPWMAVLVAVAAALAPANALTPFFMPEAAYYFSFWLLCWALLRTWDRPSAGRVALLGALLGIAAMVKLHALFLLPGAGLFVAYAVLAARDTASGDAAREQDGTRRHWLVQVVLLGVVMGAAFAAARFGIGYLLAGKAGLHLLGELYANQVSYTAKSHVPYPQLVLLALNNLRGHAMMLALLFGVPLAVLLGQTVTLLRHGIRRDPVQAMTMLTLLMLGSALAVTVMFTASITGLGEQEVASRIHTRYYHFALPLLLLCCAGALGGARHPLATGWRVAIGLFVAGFIVYGKLRLLQYFTPGIVDSPELLAVSWLAPGFQAIAVLGTLAALVWIARPALGARLFMLVFLPLSTLYCAAVVGTQVRMTIRADAYTKAGLFARHFLTRAQTDRMVIAGEVIGGLHSTRFHIENPNTGLLEIPAGSQPNWAKLPAQAERVLMIGKYELPEGAQVEHQLPDIALVRLGARRGRILNFSGPLPKELVRGAAGVTDAQPWGTWTEGEHVTITFAEPLPKRFRLTLVARAFGPNAGETVTIAAGDARQQVVFPGATTVRKLEFATDGSADTLEFTIPKPTAPRQLNINADDRLLGLGLETLRIEALGDEAAR